MEGKEPIRIAGAQGFYGDSRAPLGDILSERPDYIVCEALAELTLAILQKDRQKDPSLGYARDLPLYLSEILPRVAAGETRLVTNAGGINPAGAAAVVNGVASRLGIEGLRVGVVVGDGIRRQLAELTAVTGGLRHIDTGEPLSIEEPLFATAYLGAGPVAAALDAGADVVVTGRVADASLFVAPMIHEFGWNLGDFDRLAAGVVVGHLCECSGQVAGGNWSGNWKNLPRPHRYGFPIVEVWSDGRAVITKPEKSGGRVSVDTVKEQLLYEVGDPRRYLNPDCVADFTTVELTEEGPDRVAVTGTKGGPPTASYKAIICGHAGWCGEAKMTFSWPDGVAKARRAGEILLARLDELGGGEDVIVEYMGAGRGGSPAGVFGPATPEELDYLEALPLGEQPNEVTVRVAVRTGSDKVAAEFAREAAAMALSGPPSVFGVGRGGAGRPSELLEIWPTLVPKKLIDPEVRIEVWSGSDSEPSSFAYVDRYRPPSDFWEIAEEKEPAVTGGGETTGSSRFVESGDGVELFLAEFCQARSGDKADTVNIALFAPDELTYDVIREAVTAERVKSHLGRLVEGAVRRYEVPNVKGLNFVCEQALGGGAASSLRSDNLGKTFGANLLAMKIRLPAELAERIRMGGEPPPIRASPFGGNRYTDSP